VPTTFSFMVSIVESKKGLPTPEVLFSSVVFDPVGDSYAMATITNKRNIPAKTTPILVPIPKPITLRETDRLS